MMVLFLAVFASTALAVQENRCDREIGVAYVGSWEVSYYWKDDSPTIDSCHDFCLENSDCNFYSYNTSSVERVCTLYPDLDSSVLDADFTSGEACPCKNDGVEYVGSWQIASYWKGLSPTIESCNDLCDESPECNFYSYNTTSLKTVCILYPDLVSFNDNTDFASEVGVAFIGSWEVDYYWIDDSPSIESCNKLCIENSNCNFFSYNTSSPGRVCTLYPDLVSRIADSDFTSAEACSSKSEQPKTCPLEVGVAFVGSWEVGYYWIDDSPNIESCNNLCIKNSDCHYFSYNTSSPGRVCTLYPDLLERIVDSDFTSAEACLVESETDFEDPETQCALQPGVWFQAREISYYWIDDAPDIETCQGFCDNNTGCLYFFYNYSSSGRRCDLLAEIDTIVESGDYNMTSGCTQRAPVDNSNPLTAYGQTPIIVNSSITKASPMTGFYAYNFGEQTENHDFNFQSLYLSGTEVSFECGNFDLTAIENKIQTAWEEGKHVIFRVATYGPGMGLEMAKHEVNTRFTYESVYYDEASQQNVTHSLQALTLVPKWVRDAPDYKKTALYTPCKKLNPDECVVYELPDWTSKTMQTYYRDLMKAFAHQFANDFRVFLVQGFFGAWGEGHAWPNHSEDLLSKGFYPSYDYQSDFFTMINKKFKNADLLWSTSIDAGNYDDGSNWSGDVFQSLKGELEFGTYDDTFLNPSKAGFAYNHNLHEQSGDYLELYKKSPNGGEVHFYSDENGYIRNTQFNDVEQVELYKFRIRLYRMSYMGMDGFSRNYNSTLNTELALSIGCKFQLVSITNSEKGSICLRNSGSAPFYKDAYIFIGEKQSKESLRNLRDGQIVCHFIQQGVVAKDNIIIKSSYSPNGTIQFEANNLVVVEE
eukprot:Awhi_evm1s13968